MRVCSFQIVIKVNHLLYRCVKLAFIPTVEISSRVLELTNLCFYLIKILSHLVLVGIVCLCYCLQTSFKFLLISDIKLTLVLILILKTSQFFLDLSIFASLSLTAQLLLTKVFSPLILNRTKVIAHFLGDGLHLLYKGDWDLNSLVLHI